jgi:hypothetical protein
MTTPAEQIVHLRDNYVLLSNSPREHTRPRPTTMSVSMHFPTSDKIVSVKLIRSFASICLTSKPFYTSAPGSPPVKDKYTATGFSFLVEHADLKQRIVFDLGLRKDLNNFTPGIKRKFGLPETGLLDAVVEKDVATQLGEHGVDLGTVGAVIWR